MARVRYVIITNFMSRLMGLAGPIEHRTHTDEVTENIFLNKLCLLLAHCVSPADSRLHMMVCWLFAGRHWCVINVIITNFLSGFGGTHRASNPC